ncbi:prenylated Rab acceptor protein 1-like [Paramacrobiotus metropolitanus]|uniref:prenylated Rab acceptor protein 1-like n=1 Tax=Paramacrobiotus metropolitanus TaxID=2943436 RepID=UPI00244634E3|nr:prenylated Rab acceptor protein 1-like [Paramacrobiotus metropolitanus]XP_055336352.1 prenylated Rab acceptor protein 1-like [Paramacrobiotus metropolitanus]
MDSTTIDISGNMEIPKSTGGMGAASGMIPGSAPAPAADPIGSHPAFAAAGFANNVIVRKLWSGLQSVREIPLIKQTTSTGRQNMRSWFEFGNYKRFRKPTVNKLLSKEYYTGRLFRNIQHFHVNYICIFLILFIYCVLTSPLLLIALFASGGLFYYASAKNSVRKIAIAGREITLFHQYCVIGVLSLLMFYLVGAGGTFMTVLTLSLFIMLLHAAFFSIEDDGQEYAFQLEEV